MTQAELRDFLEAKVDQYEHPGFIAEDPIAVPHDYLDREDQEIAAFLVATLAWGQRPRIVKSGRRIMELMDGAPAQFIRQHRPGDRKGLAHFVHRTFQPEDLVFFVAALQDLYLQGGGLRGAFQGENSWEAIGNFRRRFLSYPHAARSEKHISNPDRNSACKRLHMFLRWMLRPAKRGVDLGLWDQIPLSQLSIPLDVHSGRVARKLGLLQRKASDGKAVRELDESLRALDPQDPVRYDYALFGLGIFEGF